MIFQAIVSSYIMIRNIKQLVQLQLRKMKYVDYSFYHNIRVMDTEKYYWILRNQKLQSIMMK